MVSSINNNTQAISNATSSAGLVSGANSTLDKTAFLKLLIEQLKHQDPLKPQDDTQFIAQLAQFSSLEQSMQTNSALSTMTNVLQGDSNAQATSLVGKSATLEGKMLVLDGSGSGATGTFSLASASKTTKAIIKDSGGNLVRELDLGSKNVGIAQFKWDGRNASGDLQPVGNYVVTIVANASDGSPVTVSQNISGVVKGVSFDQGYPVLNLDNGVSAPISELLRVDTPPSNP
jgi:flagellar basal-body rod modification protein FlgD